MFRLITGTPGSSKTSHTIARFLNEKSRPIYYRGIRLTDEGKEKLGWFELTDDQAIEWHKHVPEGAIVLLDEAQQLFPVRPPAKPVPPGLQALETHRHHGWDVEFITQEPTLLDSHARKICNEQFHYVRPFGSPFANQYHSGSGFVSPSNRSDLARCTVSRKKLPKETWGLYHSAEVHTHKFKPPKILFVLLAAVLLCVYLFWAFFDNFQSGQSGPDSVPVVGESVSSSGGQHAYSEYPSPVSVDWGEVFKPDVRGLPFTAPIYRDEATSVSSVPVVHGCMSMRSDFSDCSCHTQQGTRIADMPNQMCVRILKDGMFNHLASSDDREGRTRRDSVSPGEKETESMAGVSG
ncbi:zonular occludens toxin domain-containing protein [Alcanivorax sp.]|uniref:zonular occludens toxin domain-containing protein n=1 Tax=Alcanivorax sp. TaxID=1872427 RepID=UPI002B269586|nr:zonular occludens toxin domain-containing protein [Alcanivorax sp.]